ncbi:MAG: cyclic nucleotide-binding domain-containing protein [Rhodospirillales bacterium]|nr:cyclic nucleotide-binding domain-containing protein [Rhodospirillales bacterium]
MILLEGEFFMGWVEIIGYAASGAVFVTFCMKTLITLRAVAIIGNILFLVYGIYADLGNIILLHGAMLPLNGLRLRQSLQLRQKIRHMAHAAFNVQALLPFMTRFECAQGQHLFRRGDDARDIFYLLDGRVRIEELGVELTSGNLIGEIAMFTEAKTRTQSVRCLMDSVFMRITEERALELYAENPEFGLYLTKMMVQRLLINSKDHQTKPSPELIPAQSAG